MYSIKFHKCRHIYPHKIVRPLKKSFVDHKQHLYDFLHDLCKNGLTIDCFIADNPKRAFIKSCLNHSALFACEYCFAKGVQCSIKKIQEKPDLSKKVILEKIKKMEKLHDSESKNSVEVLKQVLVTLEKNNKEKTKKIIVWPSSTSNKELRTTENILEIIEKIEEEENEDNDDNDKLTRDDLKGVVGRSFLFDIDGFDFVNNVPPEYMHLSCLGVIKRLTELTFNVGLNRSRITKRKMSSTKTFNILMSKTKVVYEFSRRARDLDFSVFKAEEFRNLILFFFPHVLSCIEEAEKERELWLYLAFMMRSCVLPDSEFFNISPNIICMCCEKFYKLYEKLFGPSNCTYSIHVLCSHLLQLRQLGPLTETSVFKFESFYGEIRNSFVPGTPSPLKQILETVLLKRSICAHTCEKPIFLSNYDTPLQCNSLVYTYENDNYNIFKVIDEQAEDVVCKPQGKFDCQFKETPELCWSSVGVFQKGASSNEIVKVPHKSIAGKVLKVGEYLLTCPENVLKEK